MRSGKETEKNATKKIFLISKDKIEPALKAAITAIHGDAAEIIHQEIDPHGFQNLGAFVKENAPIATCYVVGAVGISVCRHTQSAPNVPMGFIDQNENGWSIFFRDGSKIVQQFPPSQATQ